MKWKIHVLNAVLTTDLGTYVKSLKDGIYSWEIKKYNRLRSNDQNEYYWWVVIKILSLETGYEEEEMHEILKSMFLSEKERLRWDRRKKVTITKSTSALSTKEFEEFLEKVRRWAAKTLSCYIPLPNEPPSWTESIPTH
jgi:hypothetical protein